MDLQEIFKVFKRVTRLSEVLRMLEAGVGENTYRIEVLHSYSSAKLPCTARVYLRKDSGWQQISDFTGNDEPTAIRTALSFLEDRER